MTVEDGFLKDPVQGLIDYVNDTKPYHSKIVDVFVEYIYTDVMDISVSETLQIDTLFDVNETERGCEGGFDTQGYDVYFTNVLPEIAITGIDFGTNTIFISEDNTVLFPSTKTVVISDSTDNDGTYTVLSSVYNATFDRTEVVLVELLISGTVDGTINSYIVDGTNTPLSSFDVIYDESCDISLGGKITPTTIGVVFSESLTFQIETFESLGGPFDDIEIITYDGFGESGFDV